MRVRVVLTGPPRVVLGRPILDLSLPAESCSREEFLSALATAEPRIACYLADAGAKPASPFRLLLDDRLLEPGAAIPDGVTVTLLYAVAGGSG
jgi:hypothetical protein